MCVIYSVFVNYVCYHCCIIATFKDQLAQTVNYQTFIYTLALTNSIILCLCGYIINAHS